MQECIISSQNRFDLPELFVEDPAAVYLENKCADDRFLNKTQNKVDTEEATLSSRIEDGLFFKSEKLLPNATSSMFLF